MESVRPRFIPGIFSGSILKLIGIVCMAIDHVGISLFPNIVIFRIIGRISFPIFCFLIVEGFRKTSSVPRYLIRLFVFGLISEVPFDLAIFHQPFYIDYQNVFFTLFFGTLMLWVIHKAPNNILMLLGVLACGFAAYFFKTDYAAWGVALILAFYVASIFPLIGLMLFLILMIFKGGLEMWGIISILPIILYNGRRGFQIKYLFYAFYPMHLLVIYAVFYWLNIM